MPVTVTPLLCAGEQMHSNYNSRFVTPHIVQLCRESIPSPAAGMSTESITCSMWQVAEQPLFCIASHAMVHVSGYGKRDIMQNCSQLVGLPTAPCCSTSSRCYWQAVTCTLPFASQHNTHSQAHHQRTITPTLLPIWGIHLILPNCT